MVLKKLSFGFYRKKTFYYFKNERNTYKNHLFKIEFNSLQLDYLFYFLYCFIFSEMDSVPDVLQERIKSSHFLRLSEIRHIAGFLRLSRFNVEFLYDTEIKDLLYLLNEYNFNIKTFFKNDSFRLSFFYNNLPTIKNELIFKFNKVPYNVIGLEKDIPLGTIRFTNHTKIQDFRNNSKFNKKI